MNTKAISVVERTNPDRRKSRRASTISGHRFALGSVIVRPKAYQRLWKIDVYFAVLRHQWRALLAQMRRAKREAKQRPFRFLAKHSRYFTGFDCLHLSAFHDRAGTKFYIITLLDLFTVVALPEEF